MQSNIYMYIYIYLNNNNNNNNNNNKAKLKTKYQLIELTQVTQVRFSKTNLEWKGAFAWKIWMRHAKIKKFTKTNEIEVKKMISNNCNVYIYTCIYIYYINLDHEINRDP